MPKPAIVNSKGQNLETAALSFGTLSLTVFHGAGSLAAAGKCEREADPLSGKRLAT